MTRGAGVRGESENDKRRGRTREIKTNNEEENVEEELLSIMRRKRKRRGWGRKR